MEVKRSRDKSGSNASLGDHVIWEMERKLKMLKTRADINLTLLSDLLFSIFVGF